MTSRNTSLLLIAPVAFTKKGENAVEKTAAAVFTQFPDQNVNKHSYPSQENVNISRFAAKTEVAGKNSTSVSEKQL